MFDDLVKVTIGPEFTTSSNFAKSKTRKNGENGCEISGRRKRSTQKFLWFFNSADEKPENVNNRLFSNQLAIHGA